MTKFKPYPLWTDLPYAGENTPPKKGVEPYAGSWNTYFLRIGTDGFETLDGSPVLFEVEKPERIRWDHQLRIVKRTLANLTEEEIMIAKYWGSGPPSKQWTPIADRLIDTYNVEAPRAGRILGALFAGLSDALVVTWYLKYKWLVARPNQLDDQLATVICTPEHPTYPSGHATVSGAAEVILSYFFPAEKRRLRQLAEEDAKSRLYAGVHFPVDNEQGLKLGRQIGGIVVEQLRRERDRQGERIDTPYRENRHAPLIPPPYEQAIPFEYDQNCNSLLIDDKSIEQEVNTSSPKLFI
ncbi:vanadium-dependent haloperoxidase [Thalassobacillus devorans]|uniref:vanadium-dependent haloperoxidase n=1 Tax=Thalassobacillus devorans TaxID=279813 RepID=UPI00048FC4E3|nr:vanadium-dependent haloperoxidase [Thalassobacillus devorans]